MIGLTGLAVDTDDDGRVLRCSRAGCNELATTTVNWRNPKIHTPDRVKVWLACNEHILFLSEFLLARNFPVQTAPLGVTVDRVSDTVHPHDPVSPAPTGGP